MMHKRRRWCLRPGEDAEELATQLTQHTWTLCTAFELGGYLFLNDSTSENGAQEYAVLKRQPNNRYVQIESITFGWCTTEQAYQLIHDVLVGKYDDEAWFGGVSPAIQTREAHRDCSHCA